jgi:hypothetical protein
MDTIICDACGQSSRPESDQFTYIDDFDNEHEYIFCICCWDEIQDKIHVGKDNYFRLKAGCEIELNAYSNVKLTSWIDEVYKCHDCSKIYHENKIYNCSINYGENKLLHDISLCVHCYKKINELNIVDNQTLTEAVNTGKVDKSNITQLTCTLKPGCSLKLYNVSDKTLKTDQLDQPKKEKKVKLTSTSCPNCINESV